MKTLGVRAWCACVEGQGPAKWGEAGEERAVTGPRGIRRQEAVGSGGTGEVIAGEFVGISLGKL